MTNPTKFLPLFLMVSMLNFSGCTTIHSSITKPTTVATTIPDVVTPIEPIAYFRNGRVEFYFATGQKDVVNNARDKSQEILEAMKMGKHLGITSFINPNQDLPANPTLTKNRIESIKQFLIKNGVPEAQIQLVKPIETESTEGALFRRVDVFVLDDSYWMNN